MKDTKVQHLTRRYLRKLVAEAPEAPEAAPAPAPSDVAKVTPARMIDLIVFCVAVDTYRTYLEAKGAKPDTLLTKGYSLLRRFFPELEAGLQQYIFPLGDRGDAGMIRSLLHKAQRTGTPQVVLPYQVAFFQTLLPWMRQRGTVLIDIFPGRATKAARNAAIAVQESSPPALLNRLALITPTSGLTSLRKWAEAAASASGVPVSEEESIRVDTQVAATIGEDLNQVEAKISNVSPNTPEAAQLQDTRTTLLKQLKTTAEASADKSAVRAAAHTVTPASTTTETRQYATEIGKQIKATGEQEDAMMVRGRALLAAGAGSGKTRVLASKVVWHINDLGVDPSSIVATTFTRKASKELIDRIQKYGGKFDDRDAIGFGTTHAVAGRIMDNAKNVFKRKYFRKEEGYKQTKLLRLAIEQVKMLVPNPPNPPAPVGLWGELTKALESGKGAVPAAPVNPPGTPAGTASPVEPTPVGDDEFEYFIRDILPVTLDFYRDAARKWSPGPREWAQNQLKFLESINTLATEPQKLTIPMRDRLNKLFEKVRFGYKGPPAISFRFKTAAAEEDAPAKKKSVQLKDYYYFSHPANQWFNLGLELTRESAASGAQDTGFGKKKQVAIPVGEFKNAVSILKGKGISPTEAWAGVGPYGKESDKAAVYAAYEWLKGSKGEADYVGTGDMDDLLIDTVRAMIENPNLLKQVNSQFKVILVDEAQDLNRVQHVLFGLMAGYLDPKTLKPWPDGHMTADTFCLIGDDKQAIYEFRGADPDEFIEKSDLYEVEPGKKGDFKTKLLARNFRSGKAIVDAANKLIGHNKKQVPMACDVPPDKAEGQVVARMAESVGEAAESVANEVEEEVKNSPDMGRKYSDYGVSVRSNAEAYEYGLELLKRGIPFKCNAQFFNDPAAKALIGWLTLAEKGLDGPPEVLNKALVSAAKAPFSRVGERFFEQVAGETSGAWPKFIVEGGWTQFIAPKSKYADTIRDFAENIEQVAGLSGTPSEIMHEVIQLKGFDGQTLRETLIQKTEENDEIMSELVAESETGQASEEQIVERAMAPLAPLIGLLEGKPNLPSAMDFVRELQHVNEKIASKDTDEELKRNAVTIGTMHSWKGLEIPTMYVPMIGGRFPRAGKDGVAKEEPALWSERRLAYVAITRAENRCVILDIPNPKFKTRSQFIEEACIPRVAIESTKGEKTASYLSDEDIEFLEAQDIPDESIVAEIARMEKGK